MRLERRDGRPLRIGHRGAAALAPENTLRSFRTALALGVDLIELDVLELAGGELVLAHSDDLREVTHGAARGRVRGRTAAELRELAPELPALEEALAFFAQEATATGVHVDLKSPRAARRVAELVARFGLAERTLVSTFHVRALRELAATAPGLRTAFSFPRGLLGLSDRGRLGFLGRAGLRLARLALPSLIGPLLALTRASGLALHHSVVSAEAVRRAHARGAAVLAWTVDRHEDLARMEEAGVDAVVTNDPTIFRTAPRETGSTLTT
ncbi:MAG TPA: glycerophosphodiester phosphodiesterase [Gaiellaceae bacterium]|nr:glycerophosphodiester phosphodiesterase [Gaiellaceae bacterium]